MGYALKIREKRYRREEYHNNASAVIFGSFAVNAIFRRVNDGRALDTLHMFALAAAREIGMCGH